MKRWKLLTRSTVNELALIRMATKGDEDMKPTYVGTFTKGLTMGQEFAGQAGRDYVERLCTKIIESPDFESAKGLCRTTIALNRKASDEYRLQEKKKGNP